MKTFSFIFVVATTLTMILRGIQSQIPMPTHTHPRAGPVPSGETNSGGSRMTSVDDLMIVMGPNGEERPYKMLLQMQPSQPNNSTEEDMLLMKVLRNTFMVGMRNLSTLTSGANSSKPASANKFMMQLQPEKADNLEDTLVLNLLTLTVKGNVNVDNEHLFGGISTFRFAGLPASIA